jgi:ABC-type phosphate transport system substrate-binding protein
LPDADMRTRAPCRWFWHHLQFHQLPEQVCSPEWKSKVGEGTAVNWPVGAGGKGNEGVAAFVNRLPNSMGYVEYSYVKQNKMTYAVLQNSEGNFCAPEDETFKAAAAGADWAKSFYQIHYQSARQGRLAHFDSHFHLDACQAGQAGQCHRNLEVLQLGLQEW